MGREIMRTRFITTAIIAVGLFFAPALNTSAFAEMKALTDGQMDRVTAGTLADNRGDLFAHQESDGSVIEPVIVNDDVYSPNVVNIIETAVNTVSQDNSDNYVMLDDHVQEDAKAVSIVNGIGNKAAVGVNAHAILDRGLGGLSASGLSSGSAVSPPVLNQSNILIQLR
jgi:hypothetical protein